MSILDAVTTRSVAVAVVGAVLGVITLCNYRRHTALSGEVRRIQLERAAERDCRRQAARWVRENREGMHDMITSGGEEWAASLDRLTPAMILRASKSNRENTSRGSDYGSDE